jgi:predicted TIM-barrel fold metal-dependent hydrolase
MPEDLLLKNYLPHPELVTPTHLVARAKFPAVDAHNHLTHPGTGWEERLDINQVLSEMESANVAAVVNLSGGTGEQLERALDHLDRPHPGRFITYCNINFSGIGSPGWTEKTTAQLQRDIRAGARGLKIFKELGLRYRDTAGKLVAPDDPRLNDLWDLAGEAHLPVTIHTADPTAFFKPLDRFNERWDELHEHPDWHFYGPEFPPFEALIESLYHLIEIHPKTNFITAHVGCYPENLGFVSQMLNLYPNFYTDIAARLAELGRVPYRAREWFIKYADRILFGTDFEPTASMYQIHWRFFETADEYFSYSPFSPVGDQGRFYVYGLYLPEPVMKQVYHDNAARLYHF